MKIKYPTIIGSDNRPISMDVRWKKQPSKAVVVFCHGYKGFKDWGAWNLVANRFAENDFVFLKFNMSHNGTDPDHPEEFVNLEAFAQNTYSKELNDLNTVIEWVKERNLVELRQDLPVLLVGHSRGGGIVTLGACENSHVVAAFAGWAPVSDFGVRFPLGRHLDEWKRKGVYYVKNARTNQQLPHYYSFYEDYLANAERLNIRACAKRLEVPALFCHALDDPAVHVSESMRLHKWMRNSELEIYEHGGHTFGTCHPPVSNTLPFPMSDVVNRTISFFNRNLGVQKQE